MIPFGPTNTTPFYIAMIKDLKEKGGKLCILRCTELKTYKGNTVTLTAINIIMIGKTYFGEQKSYRQNIVMV